MSVVSETVMTYLPAKRKQTPSGWFLLTHRVATTMATVQTLVVAAD